MEESEVSLQEMIKRVTDKEQKEILSRFQSTLQDRDTTFVSEYKDYYEITVVHDSSDGYTGGAEGYRIDKRTGKSEMIWHEHPMELPELNEIEEVRQPSADDSAK